MERYFCQGLKGQGTVALNQKRMSLDWTQGRNFLGWGQDTETSCPEKLWIPHDWCVDDQVGRSFERPAVVPVHGNSRTACSSNVPCQPKPFYDTRKDTHVGCIVRKLVRTRATQAFFESSGLKQTACVVCILFSCLILCVLDFVLAWPSCFVGQTLYHFLQFAWKQRSDWHQGTVSKLTIIAILFVWCFLNNKLEYI